MAHMKYANGMEPTAALYLSVMVHVKSADDIEPTASDDESSLCMIELFTTIRAVLSQNDIVGEVEIGCATTSPSSESENGVRIPHANCKQIGPAELGG